jgi:glycosyltransferase involved in cell wall biosynthesis
VALGEDASAAPGTAHQDAAPSVPSTTVSIVMPTYNRIAGLRRALEALTAQTFPRSQLEVIVVSDGSTDGTDEYLATEPPTEVVVVSQANGGPAAARNTGIQVASGEIVLFVDDDVIASPRLVEEHVLSHRAAGRDVAVIGPMMTPPDFEMSTWVRWEQAMLYRQYDAMKAGVYEASARQFYTGNASVAREQLLEHGGFDTRFRRGEDIELAYRLDRAGLGWAFNFDAIGYHYADRSFTSWLSNAHDYGVCDALFARDYGRDDVREIVRVGFQCRPAPVRWMTYGCLDRPRVASMLQKAFVGGYHACETAGADRLARFALSGMYNISYYRGISDELGGRVAFKELVAAPEERVVVPKERVVAGTDPS